MARAASYDRTEILGKARDLFWAKGYHATSLKDLEVALGMHPGSIYAAFGSKETLYAEALKLYAEDSGRDFARLLAAHESPLEGLAAHVRRLGAVCDRDVPSRACMLVKTVLETPDDDPVLRRSAEDLMRKTEQAFAEGFRTAQAKGELSSKADPARLARRLQSEIFGLRAYAQRTDAAGRVQALADDIASDIEALRDM